MSNRTHTPGPWKRSQMDPEMIVTEARPNIIIADIRTTGMGYAVDPNANLIAAAPELLAALEQMDLTCSINQLNPCWNNRPGDRPGLHYAIGGACPQCYARFVIAKVKGELCHE